MSNKEDLALQEEARRLSRSDLHYLTKEILGYDKVTDHIHQVMSKDIDTPQIKFKLLLWPRGHYKSTIGTESYPIKKLLTNPNERILITNVKLDNSRKFLRAIATQFENNSMFRWVWRKWWIDKYANKYQREELGDSLDWVVRNVQDEFTLLRPSNLREASITTGAVDASMVSQHYSTIIADDLINRDYVRTPEMIEKSITYFKDLLDLLDPDGELLVIGTRWHHMDLYNWIIDNFGHKANFNVPKGYVSSTVLAEAAKTSAREKDWFISIRPVYDGEGNPIFPEEYNHKVLKDLELAKGPYEFGAQYLLNPTPESNQEFKAEWFKVYDTNQVSFRDMTVCVTVDPAKSMSDRADRTAIIVCGFDSHNRMYLLDGINERLNVDELPDALFEMMRTWSARAGVLLPVGFEAVGFQETYISAIERMQREQGFFFSIDPITRRTASKEERIRRLIPRIKNEFYIPVALIKHSFSGRDTPYDLVQRLKWEALRFPFAGYDDILDAMADQLDLVSSQVLPQQVIQEKLKQKWVHKSMLQDQGELSRDSEYSVGEDDAVRGS